VILLAYFLISVLALIPAVILVLGMWAYAAYWAFNIRRALTVRLYRNQALGVALVVVAEVVDLVAHLLAGVGVYLEYFVLEAIFTLIVFYFIDASILAGRRSDPLLRNTIRWRSLRLFLWPVMVAMEAVIISVATYFQVATGTVPSSTLNLVVVLFDLLALASVGAVGILLTALRSKDPRLHAHFTWIAVFVVFLFVPALPGNNIVILPAIVNGAVVVGGLLGEGYSLYRSAKALVPLNRLEPLA
jgi:hypothetical protein